MRFSQFYLMIFVLLKLASSSPFKYQRDLYQNILEPVTLNSPNDSHCIFQMTNDSTEFQYAISETINWEDGLAQHINLDIVLHGNDTERHAKHIILPKLWLLTYIDPKGPFYYVSWISDFRILSMGLLNDYSKKPINVKINETSGQCEVVIGNNSTTVGITRLLLGMVRNYVQLDKKHDYENINLCYFSKFQWFIDSGWFELKKYFGIPFQEFGYKCCTLRNETVYCDDKLHRNEGYRLEPYAIAVMLVCFSPFFLLFVATCMDIDIESKLEDFACSPFQRNPNTNTNYVPIYFEHPILIGLFDDHDYKKKDIGVLGKCEFKCCASCLSCFGKIYQTHCQPRVKRFVFVLISPMFIYLEWIVFYLLKWTNRIEELNKNEILFGFTSVIGGVKFDTFMYPTGPLFALVFYIILGISILVLPKDFENSVIIGDNTQYSAILNLLNVLSPSSIDVYSGKGYKFLKKTLSTFTFLPCNPAYWLSVKEKPTTIVCRIMFIFIFLPFIVLPILPFSILMIYGWMAYSFKKLKIENTFIKMKDKNVDMTQTGNQTNQQENESTQPISESIQLEGTDTTNLCNNQNNSSVSLTKFYIGQFFVFVFVFVFKIFIWILLFIAFMLFMYYLVVIISYSIYLLIYILYFTCLAFIVLPNESSKYLIFIIWGVIFFVQVIQDSKHFYKDLFDIIVEVCKTNDSFRERYIIKENNVAYISKNIVLIVFRRIHPVFVQIGHIFLKVGLVILVYVSAFLFLNNYSFYFVNIGEHISVFITSITPIILQYVLKTHCQDRKFVEFIIESIPANNSIAWFLNGGLR